MVVFTRCLTACQTKPQATNCNAHNEEFYMYVNLNNVSMKCTGTAKLYSSYWVCMRKLLLLLGEFTRPYWQPALQTASWPNPNNSPHTRLATATLCLSYMLLIQPHPSRSVCQLESCVLIKTACHVCCCRCNITIPFYDFGFYSYSSKLLSAHNLTMLFARLPA